MVHAAPVETCITFRQHRAVPPVPRQNECQHSKLTPSDVHLTPCFLSGLQAHWLLSAMAMTFTHLCLLLLDVYLSTHVHAKQESRSAVRWMEKDRSIAIELATPDLFYCRSPLYLGVMYLVDPAP